MPATLAVGSIVVISSASMPGGGRWQPGFALANALELRGAGARRPLSEGRLRWTYEEPGRVSEGRLAVRRVAVTEP
jgi:hypothetical protein